jgi:signal transduction histidine kinase
MKAMQKAANGRAAALRPLRVLLVEDSSADAFLLEHALKRGGFDSACERVDTAEAMSAALDRRQWDLILADHSMPQFSAPAALELTKQKNLDVPFIIVSGHIEEDTAVAAMKAGAHDYVMKDRLGRLVPAVERELREAEIRRAQRQAEAELRRAHDELETRVERRTADLKAANERLQSVLEERRRLENELLEIAENERRSIGFDLHDDLGQKLTGVSLMIKGLERRLAQQQHAGAGEASAIRELIEQAIHHTHNLAHQFGSLDVSGNDFSAVFRELAANAEKMFGISCTLTLHGEIPVLPGNGIVQLCKIAQEAISNAVKHGKATRVLIGATVDSDKLVLIVRNDGVPFSVPEGKKNRMGLRIMNYRANTIGATFDVRPDQKYGTIVTCVLPIKTGSRPHAEEPPRARAVSQSGLKVRTRMTIEQAVP